jgi:opacity protein-like surface antigen
MGRSAAAAWLFLAFVLASSPAFAQLPPDASLEIGGRVWVTTGYSTNSTGLSELRWRGVDSVVPEINVDFVLRRLVLLGSIGGGVIKEGVLIDEDFNDTDHNARVSRTRSDTDDTGLFYLNFDAGYRLVQWGTREQPGFVDALGGFQFWYERYVAFGATSAFPGVVPTISTNERVITQDWYWYSLRLGARTQVPLFRGLSARARAYVLPWSKSVVDDVHHKRGDLLHDPSFHDEADGGVGVQLDGGLTYRFWRGLSVEAGYRYWWIKSGEGTSTARTPNGDFDGRLRENSTERQGPYVGLQYRF